MATDSEGKPLLPSNGEPIKQLGFEIDDDSNKAHYVLQLPIEDADGDKDVVKALDTWKNIFVDWEGTAPPPNGLESMKKQDFNDAVRGKVMDILQGECCGFTCTAYKSADDKHVMVRILLERPVAQKAIAEQEGLRVKLKREAYTKYDQALPTDRFARGEFLEEKAGETKVIVDHVTLSKKTEAIADMNWREVDLIRMVRRRMDTYINTDKLIECGAATSCFACHTYGHLHNLFLGKWNQVTPAAIFLQWPGTQHVDAVRDYFGEELGFFFHWLNFFTRYLVLAGCVGGLVFFVENVFLDEDEEDLYDRLDDSEVKQILEDGNILAWPPGYYHRSYLRLIFTLFMCLWGAVYTKHYQQRSNFKIMEWGMKDYSIAAKVRAKYDPTYRGTPKDTAQRLGHWLLVVFFILETIVVVLLVSNWRAYLSAHAKEKVMFGMTGGAAKKIFPNLLVTANIKFVDQLWKRLSPALTERENWRTDQELKNSKIIKMFIVKFNVYYYPFLFIAFLQEHWQDDATADTCLEELKQQIYVYFPVEVAFTIGMTLLDLAKAKAFLKMKLQGQTKIFHTELQANSPSYEDGIEDTMELILGFGFLMMFTTSVTVMPLLALLSNLVQIRLIAFRLSFANKRVPPRGQEGFGAWADIVQVITFVGVLVNVGEAAFVMKPLRGLPISNKLCWFLLFEHTLLMVKLFITVAVPSVADNQKFIEEHNSVAVEIIRWKSRQGDRTPSTDAAKDKGGMADHIDVNDDVPRVDLKAFRSGKA